MADLRDVVGNFNDSINSTYLQRKKEQQFAQEQQVEMMKQLLAYKAKQDEARREAALKTLMQIGRATPEQASELAASGYGGMIGRDGSLQERPDVIEGRNLDRAGKVLNLATSQLGLESKQRELDAPNVMQRLLQQYGGQGSAAMAPAMATSGLINPNQFLSYQTGREDAKTRDTWRARNFGLSAGNAARTQQRQAFGDNSGNNAAKIQVEIDGMLGHPDAEKNLGILQQAIIGADDLSGRDKQYLLNRIMKIRTANQEQ